MPGAWQGPGVLLGPLRAPAAPRPLHWLLWQCDAAHLGLSLHSFATLALAAAWEEPVIPQALLLTAEPSHRRDLEPHLAGGD